MKKHRKRNDAWMAINGAVYNVTQYMDYHPGGWDELVRGAGRDATDMFNEIHKWVNYQSLLEACLVGKLVDGPAPAPALLSSPPPAAAPPKLLPPGEEEYQLDEPVTIKQKVSSLFSGFCAGKQMDVLCCVVHDSLHICPR